MNRYFFAGITAAALALAVAVSSYAEQGFQNISFTEQAAIEQIMNVIGGVNLRQADKASTQTLKEFSEWRERAENTSGQSANGKKLPPVRDRRAF